MQTASRWHLSAISERDLTIRAPQAQSLNEAYLSVGLQNSQLERGSCVLLGTLLKPQGLRAGTKGLGGLQASTDLGREVGIWAVAPTAARAG